jgi:hypothetical protein
VDDHCTECGFDGRAYAIADVRSRLQALPGEIAPVLRNATADALHARPDPATWSALEYLGHLRDLMAFHRHAIEQALAHDVPTLELVDPDTFVADAGYATADLEDLLGQFGRRVDRLDALLATLDASALDRRAGFGDDTIDVRLVMRSAVHEGFHHRGDIERLLGAGHSTMRASPMSRTRSGSPSQP